MHTDWVLTFAAIANLDGPCDADPCHILPMKRCRVVVPWQEGLHVRPAGVLIRVARGFSSSVTLRCAGRAADIRSILSILALCAALGSVVDIEVDGDDEADAAVAIERVFSPDADGGDSATRG